MTVSIDVDKTVHAQDVRSNCMLIDIPNGNTLFMHGCPADMRAFAHKIIAALPVEETAGE